jgi:hypothetical protein
MRRQGYMALSYDYRYASHQMSPEALVEAFDSLKAGQKIRVAMRAVMGRGDSESGTPTEYVVGRRGKGRHGETVTLLRPGQKKVNSFVKITLYKRKSNVDDSMRVSIAIGDMGATLLSIEP